MNINQLKEVLYAHISAYWGGATVVWSATAKVKPLAPLVVMSLGTVSRPSQPITQMINGIIFSAYPSETTLQIDLFTKGNAVETADGGYNDNTAVNDLLDFVNYVDSPATIEWSNRNDIEVSLMNGVQDLSEIINDSQWQYRAMVELRITFTQWTAEHYGVLNEAHIVFGVGGVPIDVNRENWQQTASGGGSDAFAEATTGLFNEITAHMEGGILYE